MIPPQVNCDWRATYTPEQAEKELFEFTFKGPGWYLKVDSCMLVIPQFECEYLWGPLRIPSEMYTFYVWNCPLEATILGVGTPPTRQDDR